MSTFIRFYSNKEGEIEHFINMFYEKKEPDFLSSSNLQSSSLEWEKVFDNPIEMADLIGVFIDNIDDFKINMWVSLDTDILINVTNHNANDLIKYLYERFPY